MLMLPREGERDRTEWAAKWAEAIHEMAEARDGDINLPMKEFLWVPAFLADWPGAVEEVKARMDAALQGQVGREAWGQALGRSLMSGGRTSGAFGLSVGKAVSRSMKRKKAVRDMEAFLYRTVPEMSVNRPFADLSDKERALALIVSEVILEAPEAQDDPLSEIVRLCGQLSSAGGRGLYVGPHEGFGAGPYDEAAVATIRWLMMRNFGDEAAHQQAIEAWTGSLMEIERAVRGTGKAGHPVIRAVGRHARLGQRWGGAPDLPQHRLRRFEKNDLLIGGLEDGSRLGFHGNESLITIGAPGRGKTQAHVLTNLLSYGGPMVVLDLKGELYRDSALYRHRVLGARILRFSLTGEGSGGSHAFNPLALLDVRPDELWDEAASMASMLVPTPPRESDPFWTNSARDLVAVLIASMLVHGEPEEATFEDLMARLALGGADRRDFFEAVIRTANAKHVPALANRAGGFLSMVEDESGKTLSGIYQTARQALSCFERPALQRATSGLDWKPEELRQGATTLYITVPFDKVSDYAPLIRAVLGTHLNRLTRKEPQRGALPLTFLLDELPQLGNFEAVVRAVEIGRSYGLRIWSFGQNVQQFEASFARWRVLVESSAVRCFMNPDLGPSEQISRLLGEAEDVFTGRMRPLASAAELAGPDFAGKVIVLQSGALPFAADKLMAFEVMPERIGAFGSPRNPFDDTVILPPDDGVTTPAFTCISYI